MHEWCIGITECNFCLRVGGVGGGEVLGIKTNQSTKGQMYKGEGVGLLQLHVD